MLYKHVTHLPSIRREVCVKKISFVLFLIWLVFLLMHGPALAMDPFVRDDHDEINAAIGLLGWFSQADAKWQISFPYKTQYSNPGIAAGTSGKNESQLNFNKIDSPMIITTGGWEIAPRFSMDVAYGSGSIHGGEGADTDRFIANNGTELEFSQSKNDITGDVRLWGLNLYYNAVLMANKKNLPLRFVVGALHYEDSLHMKNAVQLVSIPFEGLSFPSVGPFPSSLVLDQTYDFNWNMLKVGVLSQTEFAKGFSYSAAVSFYPYVEYRGEGYWNLRAGNGPNDFRTQSPNFIQTSTSGYGYDASLGLIYEVSENFELSAGYRYFYLFAKDGTDTTYFANGSSFQDSLDWVTVTRQGAYAEMVVKF
jgi:hypothetical protein